MKPASLLHKKYKHHIFGLAILIVFLGIVSLFFFLAPVGTGAHQVELDISSGMDASHVTRLLKAKHLISHETFFLWYLRLQNLSSKIQVGTYELHDGMRLSQIIHILTSGKVKLHPITIPEGWNHRQIGDFLAKKALVKDREEFLSISRNPQVLQQYKIPAPSTEGYLYPETYMIPAGFSGKKLHKLMLEKFFATIKEINKPRLYTPKELQEKIILASIVEREALHPGERPIIAQVFLNRIQKGMKLESCATIQYLFEKPQAKLYLQDLARPSSYNTYLHYGWPPAPISNPGKAALEAAFRPQKNKYLYFVVKPNGSHHFSENYRAHLLAKKKYIKSDLVASP